MKKMLHFLFAFLLTTLFNGNAFSQWNEINSTPGNTIEKFSFINDDIGYALMTSGALIQKTTDGGTTWNAITSPISGFDYMDISFPKDSVGVIVYRDLSNATTPMMIYRTLNDGLTWTNITPDSTVTGYGNAFVQFIDENIGFMAVAHLLYRTTDGGINWNSTQIGPAMSYNVQSMDFYDANNGVIGIHDGTFMYLGGMYVTTDGGQTFSETILTSLNSVVGAVDQASETISYAASSGWGSGNLTKLYKSYDGGLSWDTLMITTSLPNDGLFLFDFIDSVRGVIVVESTFGGVHVYTTVDGGLNWTFNDSISVAYAYDLELTNSTGYYTGHISQFYKWNSVFVGIDAIIDSKENQLLLYPNPLSSGSTINWDSDIIYDRAVIIDITGKEVLKEDNIKDGINLPQLRPGVYFIKLNTKEKEQIARFVIE